MSGWVCRGSAWVGVGATWGWIDGRVARGSTPPPLPHESESLVRRHVAGRRVLHVVRLVALPRRQFVARLLGRHVARPYAAHLGGECGARAAAGAPARPRPQRVRVAAGRLGVGDHPLRVLLELRLLQLQQGQVAPVLRDGGLAGLLLVAVTTTLQHRDAVIVRGEDAFSLQRPSSEGSSCCTLHPRDVVLDHATNCGNVWSIGCS